MQILSMGPMDIRIPRGLLRNRVRDGISASEASTDSSAAWWLRGCGATAL